MDSVRSANPVTTTEELHSHDDLDKNSAAHHHTLGWGLNQAAPGAETLRKITSASGPAGPQGIPGPAGPQGIPGPVGPAYAPGGFADVGWTAMGPLYIGGILRDYGAPWEAGAYMRRAGIVYFRGLLLNISGATAPGQQGIYVMPVGFRSNSDQTVPVITSGGAGGINIYATGGINLNTALPAAAWISLRGVSYPADQ